MATTLSELGADVLAAILGHVVLDSFGIATVAGALYLNKLKTVSKSICAAVALVRTPLDATIVYENGLPGSFQGGYTFRCAQNGDIGCFATTLCILRCLQSSKVFVVLAKYKQQVWFVFNLKALLQSCTGNNAKYDENLPYFDMVMQNKPVKVPRNQTQRQRFFALATQQTFGVMVMKALQPRDEFFAYCTSPSLEYLCGGSSETATIKNSEPSYLINEGVAKEYYSETCIRFDSCEDESSGRERLCKDILIYNDVLDFECAVVHDDSRPHLSQLLGRFETPHVAECNGAFVHYQSVEDLDGLKKTLVKTKDLEIQKRLLGQLALLRAKEVDAITNLNRSCQQLVVHSSSLSSSSSSLSSSSEVEVEGSGQQGKRRIARKAKLEAETCIKNTAEHLENTLVSGRLKPALQLLDRDSIEAEANGLVDDSYATIEEETEEKENEPKLQQTESCVDPTFYPKKSNAFYHGKNATALVTLGTIPKRASKKFKSSQPNTAAVLTGLYDFESDDEDL